jgi:hypothetical protein
MCGFCAAEDLFIGFIFKINYLQYLSMAMDSFSFSFKIKLEGAKLHLIRVVGML